jgi:hypothetical protein
MTLILGYINTEFAVMAADRKIVNAINGKTLDDARTKIVIWENRLLFGFTGIAEIGKNRIHTMEWLADFLGKNKTFDSSKLSTALSDVINETVGDKKYKRLAIMLVGFDDVGKIIYCLVSNTHSDSGEIINQPRDDFWVSVVKPHVRSTIRAVGWPIPTEVGKVMLTRLRKTHSGNLPSEKTVINILAGAIQKSSGAYISDTCLITTLSKNGRANFTVVTPNMKPGQLVDIASPYFVAKGAIMTMPNQRLRLSKKRHT